MAALLGLSPRTVRTHQMNGRIPFIKILGSIRFVPDDVRAWLDEQKVSA